MSAQKLIDPAEKARRAYLESKVQGADPQELLVMLYDGLLKNVMAGQQALHDKEWETALDTLVKARRIVTYLTNSLRPEGGDITDQLRSLYAFCFYNIGRANLQKDPEPLTGVLKVVRELSSAWVDLAKMKHSDQGVKTGEDL
jgi:flagellar secretion chaperone FliS